jgi:uncharacterized tellurite resistance protein B-like protein
VDDRQRAELVRELREFLEKSVPGVMTAAAGTISDRQLQLAAAILMVSVIRADRESRQDEHRALDHALASALGLAAEEAAVVVHAAEEAVAKGEAFAGVVERLARECSHDQRRQLVESLWRIAFADAELAGHEEYLVRKIAHRLRLSTADLVETKVRAREAFVHGGF